MTKNQSGQILIVVFIALGVVLFTVLSIITGAQVYFQNSQHSVDGEKAVALAEAGIDKALNSLNKTGGSYNGESETSVGDGSYSVTITSTDAATKVIEAIGYLPNKTKPKIKRTIKATSSRGVGVAFVYGVQVGEGGLQLGNNNIVQGSIYSNGNISGGNNNSISGDAWVAGGPQASADQQTDCSGSNCQDFIFGKTVNGNSQLDVAQSFQPACIDPPTCAIALNKVSLKLKKFGNPADVTVRIMADSNGKPDKNNVLATGTLFASLVTSTYGFIDVTFSTSPALSAGTTYWIMLDTSANSSNYWAWQNDLAQSYTNGVPKWSPNWNTSNPSWNSFNGDLSFKTTMGGGITSITGGSGFTVSGSVHANTISGLTISKDAYYQTLTNSTVSGTKYPGSVDPPPKVFPISGSNITDWKNQAQANNLSALVCNSTWGPGKYSGNVTIGNNCSVIVKSPIWITGNFTLGNSNTFTLDSSYGSTSGVMVIDGVVEFGNTNKMLGTGMGSSLLMILSTYDSLAHGGESAIEIGNTGNSGVFYASSGILEPGNNNQYKELTAWQIKLTNNSTINYETGLSSTLFTSGPWGSYSLIKGTYQVK